MEEGAFSTDLSTDFVDSIFLLPSFQSHINKLVLSQARGVVGLTLPLSKGGNASLKGRIFLDK